MNKLEKLNEASMLISVSQQPSLADKLSEVTTSLLYKLNEAIDHIANLESEVDRLKGHTHKSSNHRHDEAQITYGETSTTPPIMETDKQ